MLGRPLVVVTLCLGIVSCASGNGHLQPGAAAPPTRPSTAPPDVACEMHRGRCQYWHPCGAPDATVGEGTCWDDCEASRCAPAPAQKSP